MNPEMAVTLDIISLLNMENMNAGFVAEGLTSRKRAIARYMKTKATKDDKKALKFLQDMEDLTADENFTPAIWGDARDKLEKLGRLVGAEEDGFSRPEASPLALYTMALYALEPWFGQDNHDLGWDCLAEAVAQECDPVRGLYADMALRTPLSADDTGVRLTLQEFLEEAIEAMNRDIFEPRDEDLLLVLGRRFALCDYGETVLSYLVRKGLMILAKADHVDAVRLLALSHAADPSPETLWARDEIRLQAKRGRAYAMLVMGQHLAGNYFFWPPTGDREANLKTARVFLEKRARKNDLWAALTLAYSYLPWRVHAENPEALDEEEEESQDTKRALEMLETLAHEMDFAPAKAMLGAWYGTIRLDPETAWPLLRDACEQGFSPQCEAACADFLIGLILNAIYVHAIMTDDNPRPVNFIDDDHGGPHVWLDECVTGVGESERFGLITLALQRLALATGLSKDSEDDDEDDGEHPPRLSRSEFHELVSFFPSIKYGGRLAIHNYLLELASTSRTAHAMRNLVEKRIHADKADGNYDCIMADLLFIQKLFDEEPCPLTTFEGACVALAGGSNIARTALPILHIHMCFENAEDGLELDEDQIEMEMAILHHEYMQAVQLSDLPALCALPLLFKYSRRQFSPHAARKSLEYVTRHLFNGKCDLKGLVEELNVLHCTEDIDMDRLWENLGLVPHIDFVPHGGHAGYETSAMRSRRSAEARKNARRKKDKLKKAKLRKERRRKR